MPFNPAIMDLCVNNLQQAGYAVTLSPHALENHGNISSHVSNRVADLHHGFSNKQYDAIISTIGGWNSNELLPHLDFELISRHPKPFVGMSDITTLCVNLWQQSSIASTYGFQLRHFINRLSRQYLHTSFQTIFHPDSFSPSAITTSGSPQVFRSGTMSGPLVGGCLATISWLLGTPYQMQIPDQSILFLEDDEETNGYYWQMYLNHLKQAGAFANISGVIFGKIPPSTVFTQQSPFTTILDQVIGEYNFPVLLNAHFGHAVDKPLCLPCGQPITLSI